jgi:hypothetical protein
MMFGFLDPGKERKRRSPAEVREDAMERLRRETAKAGREVLDAAETELKVAVRPEKQGVAKALVLQARAELKEGRANEACATLGRALGKKWERKLRTAVVPRVARPGRKKRAPTEEAPPIPPMPR